MGLSAGGELDLVQGVNWMCVMVVNCCVIVVYWMCAIVEENWCELWW